MSTDQQKLLPCPRCLDLGLWISPANQVTECPELTVGASHATPNEAGKFIQRAVARMTLHSVPISTHAFEIARILTLFTSKRPCTRKGLLDQFFNYLPMSERNQIRELQKVIETLRRRWLLPIGSRKDSPDGYWIITDVDDFSEWFRRFKASPITQLSTAHRVAKQNFPIYAEQMEIDFFNEVEPLKPAA